MRRLKLQARPAFSYRRDLAVPRFDDHSPIVIMDGQCALCTRGARLICRLDRRGEFKIVPSHCDLARVLCHYGVNAAAPAIWLYLEDGKAYGSMEAIVRVGSRLGGWCCARSRPAAAPAAMRTFMLGSDHGGLGGAPALAELV
jgi:predicted DCC family thiol-disulfide oxidoreductase YuxK